MQIDYYGLFYRYVYPSLSLKYVFINLKLLKIDIKIQHTVASPVRNA